MIKRALISVSDKTNLEKLVSYLDEKKIEMLSTGGTYKYIKKFTNNVIDVSTFTGFPEILDGRVKTLVPQIHGAILSDRDNKKHIEEANNNNISQIDLVVVNLYPFQEVVSRGTTYKESIENIDVGGPAMVRAAAKNHSFVTILTNPNDYDFFIEEMKKNNNSTTLDYRKHLAQKAFSLTSYYDSYISNWFSSQLNSKKYDSFFNFSAKLKQRLRYGENPHQSAALYQSSDFGIVGAEKIQGKDLSYNNILDSDHALGLVSEFSDPCAVIVKHGNPCGVASSSNICDAFSYAFSCDPTSSFGGIIALNKKIEEDLAYLIKKYFFEVIIAPDISLEAREILSSKKNMRILINNAGSGNLYKKVISVSGGFLVQDTDNKSIDSKDIKWVTKSKPSGDNLKDLLFSFSVSKHVKSNAILISKNNMTLGIGAGQMSRVDSVKLAILKLNDFLNRNPKFDKSGLVLASDAFFPFADGVEIAGSAGIKYIIQPGGSVRDQEVIDKADELGIAMAFTNVRHFKH